MIIADFLVLEGYLSREGSWLPRESPAVAKLGLGLEGFENLPEPHLRRPSNECPDYIFFLH